MLFRSSDYTLVAKRTSGTDTGQNAEGSTLKTTYQVYISPDQPAGTYVGQVKYIMIHPNTAPEPMRDDQIGLIYDGNGMNFAGGSDKNRLVYDVSRTVDYYVGDTATVVKSSNITNEGTYVPYQSGEEVLQTVPFDGADKVMVQIKYGITVDSMAVAFAEGEWDGESEVEGDYVEIYSSEDDLSGTDTYLFNGDTITIGIWSWGDPIDDYDYGAYIKVYPVYDTEQSGSSPVYSYGINSVPAIGSYASIPGWSGSWK